MGFSLKSSITPGLLLRNITFLIKNKPQSEEVNGGRGEAPCRHQASGYTFSLNSHRSSIMQEPQRGLRAMQV